MDDLKYCALVRLTDDFFRDILFVVVDRHYETVTHGALGGVFRVETVHTGYKVVDEYRMELPPRVVLFKDIKEVDNG